ncbi:MAG TPA: aminodeoxychorismate lyase [Candidatus Competibacteraceae bacterium]|nr:aminodeoxychorismate lyase [Candidatus Competibacteraceae bacterium]
MSAPVLWCDGKPADSLPLADRGLHYGDGLFETLTVRDGRPELWERHWARLLLGCERLGLPQPDATLWHAEAAALCAECRRGVLKLILTRGSGGRGYRPPLPAKPTRILGLYPWPDYPEGYWDEGVTVRLCRQPLSLNPALAGLKHLNRLDQVLARAEWGDPDIAEGLMCDPLGRLIEGTMSNLFLARDGELLTPTLDQSGIAGVMRGLILELCRKHRIACREAVLTPGDLAAADEVFLSNSLIGLWPVRALAGGRSWPVGSLTRRLQALVAEARRQ